MEDVGESGNSAGGRTRYLASYAADIEQHSYFSAWPIVIGWIATVAVLATLVLLIARWAINKANSEDIPVVLTGIGSMLTTLIGWLPRLLARAAQAGSGAATAVERKAGGIAEESPGLAAISSAAVGHPEPSGDAGTVQIPE